MNEQEIRALLGLSEDADLKAALTAMREAADAADDLEAKVADLTTKITELEKLAAADEDDETEQELAAKDEQVIALTAKVEETNQQALAYKAEAENLSKRLKSLEDERAERSAQDRVDLALKQRKVTPAELKEKDGFLVKLAKEQPETFDNIMAIRPASAVNLTVEAGSGEDNDVEETPHDRVFRLSEEKIVEAHKAGVELSIQDARKAVLTDNPDLAKAIRLTQAG